MPLRVGVFLAAILFVLGMAALFTPVSYDGVSCGSWVNPAFSRSDAAAVAKLDAAFGGGDDVELIADVTLGCEGKRETRRNIGLPLGFLALAALIAPLVIPDNRRIDRAVEAELAKLDEEEVEP